MPDLLAGTRIQRIDMIEGGRDVHDAVHDNRRGLHAVDDLGLEDPGRPQFADIGGIDLAVRIVPRLMVVAVGVQEVVAVTGSTVEHVLRDSVHIAIERAAVDFLSLDPRGSYGEGAYRRRQPKQMPVGGKTKHSSLPKLIFCSFGAGRPVVRFLL